MNKEYTEFISNHVDKDISAAIILGSGLKKLTETIDVSVSIPYSEIPGFPVSTVKGHSGRVVYGKLQGKNVLGFDGRFHMYEGYEPEETIAPVSLAYELGIKNLIVSNAAGGMQEGFKIGDMMFITDYINFQHRQIEIETKGSGSLNGKMLAKIKEIAKRENIEFKEGVYVGVLGPNFETPAEYAMYYKIGGDAIGMSTVPEVMAAMKYGMDIFAVSIIVDIGYPPEAIVEISHDIVLAEADKAAPKLLHLVDNIFKYI